jgi:hypothetical protein
MTTPKQGKERMWIHINITTEQIKSQKKAGGGAFMVFLLLLDTDGMEVVCRQRRNHKITKFCECQDYNKPK